jgi:hypothetical protein
LHEALRLIIINELLKTDLRIENIWIAVKHLKHSKCRTDTKMPMIISSKALVADVPRVNHAI